MKRLLPLFFVIFTLPGYAGPEEDFRRALELHAQGPGAEAQDLFKAAGRSWELQAQQAPGLREAWFNAGNAYYLGGDKFSARRMWYRALELNPGDSSVMKNWNLGQQDLPGDLKAEDPQFYWLSPWLNHLSLGILGLGFTLWCGALGWFILKKKPLKIGLWSWGPGIVLVALLVLGLGTLKPQTALVQVPTPLLKGDAPIYEKTLDLIPGTLVQVLEERSGYTRIRLNGGKEGWVGPQSLMSTGR